MKTITPTPAEMESRIARFEKLKPIAAQREPKFRQEILDLIYARRLLPVVGLEGGANTPVSDAAPIQGAAGMTITYAVCPPGQGPSLHAHDKTFETFTVCRGRFEIRWGDSGEHSIILKEFDTISVPPKVCRAFRNVGEVEGVLQVIITGGVHDRFDIDLSPLAADEMRRIDPAAQQQIEREMFTFTAGRE